MKTIFTKRIANESDVRALLIELNNEGRLYHCEDPAEDIGIFTSEESTELNKRMDEAYALDWNNCKADCPCEIALSL